MSNPISERLGALNIDWQQSNSLTAERGKMRAICSFSDATREEVQTRLKALLSGHQNVSLTWLNYSQAALLNVADFVRNYDDLWLPGADDILIADESGGVLGLLDHEETLHESHLEK